MRYRLLALALLAAPAALAAQIPDPSNRALGMGGAYTTLARGYEAAGWNPAVLAAHGRPGFSIGLVQGQADFGSNAYSFGDVMTYNGKALSDADKQYLLDQVDSTLQMRAFAGITPFALQIGPFALSLASSGSVTSHLGRDAIELALFGNTTRSGPGEFFTAAGSRANGWAATVLAGSFAWPFRLPIGRLSAGVTVKKVWGHGLAMGRETSSHFQLNPTFGAQAAGHVIYTQFPPDYEVGPGSLFGDEGSPGSGMGVDLGGVLELGGLTLGATIVNALGSMSWKNERFRYERADYQVIQAADGSVGDVLTHTTLVGSGIDGDATARALRDSLLAHASFSRLVRAGVSARVAGLLLAADAQFRLSDGLDSQPTQTAAVGVEYVLFGVLPLRAGMGTDFADNYTFSAGSGLWLGPFRLDVGAATTAGTERNALRVGAGIGLIF